MGIKNLSSPGQVDLIPTLDPYLKVPKGFWKLWSTSQPMLRALVDAPLTIDELQANLNWNDAQFTEILSFLIQEGALGLREGKLDLTEDYRVREKLAQKKLGEIMQRLSKLGDVWKK